MLVIDDLLTESLAIDLLAETFYCDGLMFEELLLDDFIGLENYIELIFFPSYPLSSILTFLASFKSYTKTFPFIVPIAIVWPSGQNPIELNGVYASIFFTYFPSTVSKN